MRANRLKLGNPAGGIRASAVCVAVCLAALAACGSPGDEARPDASDTTGAVDFADSPTEAPDTSVEPTGQVLRADLEAVAGTDVTGSVSLRRGTGGTSVSVQIHGANSGLPYVAEIVGGSCASPGAVIAELGRITAGEQGDGEFNDVVDGATLGDEGSVRAVRVRGAGDPSAIVACGNLAR